MEAVSFKDMGVNDMFVFAPEGLREVIKSVEGVLVVSDAVTSSGGAYYVIYNLAYDREAIKQAISAACAAYALDKALQESDEY